MKFALVNPPWTFDGSIYFGCREPHLPVEYGYARALLGDGHEVLLLDAQLYELSLPDVAARLAAFAPDRSSSRPRRAICPGDVRRQNCACPRSSWLPAPHVSSLRIVVGPHASTTPAATLHKLGADVAVLGECEEILPRLAADPCSGRTCHRSRTRAAATCMCRARHMCAT